MNHDKTSEKIGVLYAELEANTHSDHIKHAECAKRRKEIQLEISRLCRIARGEESDE